MDWIFFVFFGVGIMVIVSAIYESQKKKKFQADCKSYSERIDGAKQALLTSTDTASLPILKAADYGYRVVGKENLLGVQDGATRMELKSTGRYRTSGSSVSIPIVKGVRYRVGSGSIQTQKEWQATAHGRLLVTDRAISFESNEKNERITWTQVADVEPLLDGFRISKRSGPPRTYSVASPDPKFAAIVELMLSRTA